MMFVVVIITYCASPCLENTNSVNGYYSWSEAQRACQYGKHHPTIEVVGDLLKKMFAERSITLSVDDVQIIEVECMPQQKPHNVG